MSLPRAAVRRVLLGSAAAAVAFVLLLSGTLTNWYRYPLSLESSTVLVPVLIVLLLVLVLHAWAFKAAGRVVLLAIAVFSFMFIVGFAAVLTHRAFGEWFLIPAGGDVDRNGDQVLRANGKVIVYHLELQNPFAESAKTYVVGTVDGVPFRIRLPIGRIAAYGGSSTPADWLVIAPTSKPALVVATVTVDPARKYVFTLDVQRNTVVR